MTIVAQILQLVKLLVQEGNLELRARCPHCGYDSHTRVNQAIASTDPAVRLEVMPKDVQ